jgi:hypothetical protein
MVFAFLKREKISRGLDSNGLANLLVNQRGYIGTGMPAVETRETYASPHLVETYAADRYVPAAPTQHAMNWVLPLFLLAGLGGLIWYLAAHRTPTVHAAREEGTTAMAPANCDMSFQQLQNKYQSVLDRARNEGVQIATLKEEGCKLIVRGTAPSLDAANRVWDQIKRVDATPNDLMADFQVSSAAGTAVPAMPGHEMGNMAEHGTMPMEPNASATEPSREPEAANMLGNEKGTYTVQAGDTLSSISKQFYGNSSGFRRILNANRDQISNQDKIEIGQELVIPGK